MKLYNIILVMYFLRRSLHLYKTEAIPDLFTVATSVATADQIQHYILVIYKYIILGKHRYRFFSKLRHLHSNFDFDVSTHVTHITTHFSHCRIHNIIPCNDIELHVLILQNLNIYIFIYFILSSDQETRTVRQHIRRRRWKSRNFYALVYNIYYYVFARQHLGKQYVCEVFYSFFINIILRIRR